MVPMAISSAVTALTAAAFLLLTRNLDENDFGADPADNARLTAQILAELDEPNVADYRTLETMIEEHLTEAQPNALLKEEIKINESSLTSENILIKPSPDLTIEASHLLRNGGQHRAYTLSLHFSPRPRLEGEPVVPWQQCRLKMEWPLPKNVFVDVWRLRRFAGPSIQTASTIVPNAPVWSVRPRHPDIEVGSYAPEAKPFLLTAEVSFSELGPSPLVRDGRLLDSDSPWQLNLHVPDLVVRYQKAANVGDLWAQLHSPPIYLPTPKLHFNCARERRGDRESVADLNVEWRLHRLRPMEISLPIGSASPVIAQITIGSIVTSSLLLLSLLFKF